MKKNKKLVIASILLFLLVFQIGVEIYAKTNHTYAPNTSVVESDLDGKLENSAGLEFIASLVYAFASWFEYLVGAAFEMLTGDNMFPWADRVIFNTIPFLDVNFLNPETGSLFKNQNNEATPLANIVVNVYSTVFTLAVTFLGVVVGVMAIKLALSSLASEKAKYKEALMKFLFSLVALFGMHYAMSFIFYINESMVEVASGILTKNLENTTIALNLQVDNDLIVDNFLEKQNGKGGIPTLWGWIFSPNISATTPLGASKEVAFDDVKNFISDDTPIITKIDGKDEVEGGSNKDIAGYLLSTRSYVEWRLVDANGGKQRSWMREVGSFFWTAGEDEKNSLGNVYADINLIKKLDSIKIIEDMLNNSSTRSDFEQTEFYKQELKSALESLSGSWGYDNYDEYIKEKSLYDEIVRIENLIDSNPKNAKQYEKELDTALANYWRYKWNMEDDEFSFYKERYENYRRNDIADISDITGDFDTIQKNKSDMLWEHIQDTREYYKTLVRASKIFITLEEERGSNPLALIADMGQFFKESAWTYETDDEGKIKGWYASKLTLQGAILYAMFITQSIMFFFAYLKRFFYIVVLALLAPVIVIYDFLVKVVS